MNSAYYEVLFVQIHAQLTKLLTKDAFSNSLDLLYF